MGKVKFRKFFLWLFFLAVLYSFFPLIPFWMMKGAPDTDNNKKTVEALEVNEGSYFSFIVSGDNHAGLIFNDAATLKQIWQMNREDRFLKVPIDFVLSTGDVTLNGKPGHFKAYKKLQKLLRWPVIAAIGNHDRPDLFSKHVGKKDFVFRNRNSFFIVIDNEVGELTNDQFIWLEEKLQEGVEYDHIFVTLHKPPFDPYQQEWYNMDNSPWAYKFRKLCAKFNVDIVFSGHKHMFKEEKFDGVTYVVTGGGGMLTEIPEADGGYLHYVRGYG